MRSLPVQLRKLHPPLGSHLTSRLSARLRSGAIGSGLGFISRHPIVSAFVSPYLLNGSPLPLVDDWFAGKSACGICVQVPGIGPLDVLNTHLFAPGGEADTIHGAHRLAQAWDLARMAAEKAERGRHVIVVRPHSLPF